MTKTAKCPTPPRLPGGLFDAVETAILCHYFGLDAELPLETVAERAGEGSTEDDSDEATAERDSRTGVRLTGESRFSEFPRADLANGVARICLNAIQDRLPNWVGQRSDGTVVHARKRRLRRKATIEGMPRHLFTINWADSGPGFSWPESYCVTLVPGFNRYVVTKSGDTEEVDYADLAIGWFEPTEDVQEASLRIIGAWWRLQKGIGQENEWSDLWDEGIIGRKAAEALRYEVWGREELEAELEAQRLEEEERRNIEARERCLEPYRAAIDAAMATWKGMQRPARSGVETMGLGYRFGALKQFLEEYALEHRVLPRGVHEVRSNKTGANLGNIDFDELLAAAECHP